MFLCPSPLERYIINLKLFSGGGSANNYCQEADKQYGRRRSSQWHRRYEDSKALLFLDVCLINRLVTWTQLKIFSLVNIVKKFLAIKNVSILDFKVVVWNVHAKNIICCCSKKIIFCAFWTIFREINVSQTFLCQIILKSWGLMSV